MPSIPGRAAATPSVRRVSGRTPPPHTHTHTQGIPVCLKCTRTVHSALEIVRSYTGMPLVPYTRLSMVDACKCRFTFNQKVETQPKTKRARQQRATKLSPDSTHRVHSSAARLRLVELARADGALDARVPNLPVPTIALPVPARRKGCERLKLCHLM